MVQKSSNNADITSQAQTVDLLDFDPPKPQNDLLDVLQSNPTTI